MDTMKKEDFCHIWRGRHLALLQDNDTKLLQPVDIRSNKKEKALLMLHGFSSSPAVYRTLIPGIRAYDAIVCPLLPGHGDSIACFSKTQASEWIEKAVLSCEALTAQYETVDVLGLSLGGLLALTVAQLIPVHHLYLLAPAVRLKLNSRLMLGLANVLYFLGFQDIRNAAGNLLSTQYAELSYKKLPLKIIIEILQLIQGYQWIAPTCGVDLFLGAQDLVVDSEAVAALFQDLPNTNIHWLKNSAHVLPLDNDCAEILACLNQGQG